MTYQSPANTEWKLSLKGNHWRKKDGVTLVVGGSEENGFWVRIGDDFLAEWEETLEEAKDAAERGF